MIKQIAFAIVLCASPAIAQDFPAHFVTDGVAANDTLNIRAMPDGTSDIIGEYGPYTMNIEVIRISNDGKWGLVGLGEQNGWVAMRFLTWSDHQQPYEFPRPMSCFGTEPFWSLNVTVRGDEYHAMGEDRRDLNMIRENAGPNGAIAVFEEGPTLNRTLIVQKATATTACLTANLGGKRRCLTKRPTETGRNQAAAPWTHTVSRYRTSHD
ncbi:hypothetical protein MWU61_15890 [Loktanella sp. F6476L]|uniref:hypothetical protein n=1 Tax=Loktanella sp. F6476L TaxID=2926405 RepID=UPI001FF405D5|nr:hypothetical protein [Loktanella sp. F6476L]MCK0122035.1 hypothetical protein [Loktanella sp. F6476L]